VKAVLSLARSLGVAAIAEGVENPGQLGLLQGLGCDVGQGFYFARPRPAAEVEVLLAGKDHSRRPTTMSGDSAIF
jgi:EAL domain-containing protein (putative c-di-GMP-specific phosphodiesterase class I)